ncbi:hypothetical protein HPB48_026854 [Haemaphysalis longicornis]|uniref:Monocarboxylate transporter n=1 Tax=Haemaphysalis longicornis TaxID=44386 RepID=A0A9J6HD92_HAELO|nr:hypothetical protein HPB48_026854 [Haemaphysalis longicornis]
MTCFGLYTMLYFDKYKATATGVKYASLAASGIAAPTIMSLIVNRYGLQGALLFCGAIAMQALPLVMLIKQPRPFKIWCHKVGTVPDSSGSGKNKQLRSIYAVEIPQLNQTSSPLRASSPYQTRPAVDMVGISAKSVARMLVIPEFYALIIVYFAVDWTGMIHTTTVVDYGRDKGVPLESANYLQTCAAVGELLGRTVVPFLSDKTPFGHCMFAAAGVVGTSLMLFGMTFYQPFACFATLNALHGVFQGYVYCIRPVLITDYLGLERLPVFFGFLGVILMPVSLANPAILGKQYFFYWSLCSLCKTVKLLSPQCHARGLVCEICSFIFHLTTLPYSLQTNHPLHTQNTS